MLRRIAPSLSAGLLALLLLAAVPQFVFAQDDGTPNPAVEGSAGQAPIGPQEIDLSSLDQGSNNQGAFGPELLGQQPIGPEPEYPGFDPEAASQDPDDPSLLGEAAAGASSIYWGAYIQGSMYGYQNPPWDQRAIDKFESHAGKRISILHWGQAWQRCSTTCSYQEFSEQRPQYDAMWQRGIIPLVDWGSWNTQASPKYEQPTFNLQRIINGEHDAYIRRWATGARDYGHPFFLRFNWEMNGNWFPWSETRNGNKQGDFVRAWRHVHDIFKSAGASNVKWVWCPNVVDWNATVPLSNYYPGYYYVDWLCMDGYNWGTNPARPSTWKSFTDLFQRTYTQLGWNSSSKPIMIAETASTEYGGSKAAWITDALSVALPQKFPRVQAIVWFNWNADRMDWAIESSSTAQAAFAKAISSSYYRAGPYNGSIATASVKAVTCDAGGCIYLPMIKTK